MQRAILWIILVLFGALTVAALLEHGYMGIIGPHFESLAGGQVFADLVIALLIILVWLWRDAKQRGRNPWPWTLITLVMGSFGPLLYLVTSKNRE